MRATAIYFSQIVILIVLAGCAGLVDKPQRATLYDFGPGATTAQPQKAPPLPALVLGDVDTSGALDGSVMLYRLSYADANQLRPYAQARWSAPPAQLVRQRLRDQLGAGGRVILNPGEGAALARNGGVVPRILRVDLEEFSQLFDSPASSAGLVRLRATLLESTAGGEKLLSQHSVVMQRPAPTQDAPGGVRALAAAVDAAAQDIAQWLALVK